MLSLESLLNGLNKQTTTANCFDIDAFLLPTGGYSNKRDRERKEVGERERD